MKRCLVVIALGLGIVLGSCSAPTRSVPHTASRSLAEMSRVYSDALVLLSARWPSTVGEADSLMERLGYEAPDHRGRVGRDYELRDSLGEIRVLVNLEVRSAIASYSLAHEVEFSDELLGGLREKCASYSYDPPDQFVYHFEDSWSGRTVVTDVCVGMPRGVWRSTTTQLHPVDRRP